MAPTRRVVPVSQKDSVVVEEEGLGAHSNGAGGLGSTWRRRRCNAWLEALEPAQDNSTIHGVSCGKLGNCGVRPWPPAYVNSNLASRIGVVAGVDGTLA